MAESCQTDGSIPDKTPPGYRYALWIAFALNASMLVVEMIAGLFADSQALQADALDFFGDSLTYAISLFVLGLSARARATAAFLKGVSLAGMAFWLLGSTLWQTVADSFPDVQTMSVISLLALAANLLCVRVLMRYREGDANMRSVWLCSRNDAIGNLAVLAAAAIVFMTGSRWPDLIVAGLMAGLFLWSSQQIIRQSLNEWHQISKTSTE